MTSDKSTGLSTTRMLAALAGTNNGRRTGSWQNF